MALVPSKMALATSVASARVGRGFLIMESSIWVAVTTCFPALYAFLMMSFCRMGSSSKGISTPISPRATMIPSAALRISSIFSTPSAFSILAMIRIWGLLLSPRIARICSTSSAVRVKEEATKSKPSSAPNRTSLRSCSLT